MPDFLTEELDSTNTVGALTTLLAITKDPAGTPADFKIALSDFFATALLGQLNTFTQPQILPLRDKGGQLFNINAFAGADFDAKLIAAHAAADDVGGDIFIPPGTHVFNTGITLAPSVGMVGAGIGATILQRGTSYNGPLCITGARSRLADFTINGNVAGNSVNAAGEINLQDDGLIERVRIINARHIGIETQSKRSVIKNCILTGNGGAVTGSYAIWAASANTEGLLITGCTITNWTLSAAYLGGKGARMLFNYIKGNHIQTSPSGGGQIAAGAAGDFLVALNFIDAGGGSLATGIEADNGPWKIIANEIQAQQRYGIILQGNKDHQVIANRVKNCGLSAIFIAAGISEWIAALNRCYDDQGVKTQDYGIEIGGGAGDNYAILGNDLRGNVNAGGLLNGASGTNVNIIANLPSTIANSLVGGGLGGGGGGGPYEEALITVSSAHTVTTSNRIILANTAGGAFTITLGPAANFITGGLTKPITVINIGTNDVTVDGNGSETINGNLDAVIPPGGNVTFISDGSNWYLRG
jgi:hypothetical protein